MGFENFVLYLKLPLRVNNMTPEEIEKKTACMGQRRTNYESDSKSIYINFTICSFSFRVGAITRERISFNNLSSS